MKKSIFYVNIVALIILGCFPLFSSLPVMIFGQNELAIITLFNYLLIFFLPVILYILIRNKSFRESLNLRKMNFLSFLLVIGFAFSIQPFTMFLSALSNLFFTNTLNDYLIRFAQKPYFYLLFVVAILPAIFEEIPTRGLVLSEYKVDIKMAALINGLFFGALHLNFQQFVYAFALGFLFVYLVRLTGSIYASILAHFIINGTQVTTLKLSLMAQTQLGITDVPEPTMAQTYMMLGIIGILALCFTPLAILCLGGLAKVNNKKEELSLKFNREDFSLFKKVEMIPFYIAMLVFVGFGILVEKM